MKKVIIIGLCIIFVGLLIVSLTTNPSNNADGIEEKGYEIKEELGAFTLIEKLSGEKALEQINFLHGKSIEIEDGYILHYESDNGIAIVWISKSPTVDEAKNLFQKMNDRMGGSTMYTDHKEVAINGITLQYVFGMDMDNYYYFKDNRVIWIAFSGDEKNQFLKTAIKTF